MYVYACIQYVYALMCMYIQVCAIKDASAQAEECNGLTDDGVSSHVLADDSGIVAQIMIKGCRAGANLLCWHAPGRLHFILKHCFVNDTGILAYTYKYIYM
jgi:hypothetical protein